jgi:type IV fimbrial biogenesis protein FimT
MSRQILGQEKGFSLLELLVVVATMSVMVAMSVPAINTVRNQYRLTTARDELVGVVEMARSAAVKLDSNTTVTFTNEGVFRIQYTANGVTRSIAYSLPSGVSFNLPSGVTSLTLECRPSGKVTITGSNGTTVTAVTVENSAGTRTLYVNIVGNITQAGA